MKRTTLIFALLLAVVTGFGQKSNGLAPLKKTSKKVLKTNVIDKKDVVSVNTFSKTKSLMSYQFAESSGTFTSISSTGDSLVPDGWDEGYYYLDLTGQFSFNYNLRDISSFSIGTNGAVILGKDKNVSLSNDFTDTSNAPLIAPIWDDLKFYGQGTNCGLFYQIDSLPSDTVLTIEWNNVERYGNEGNTVSFQVKFHRPSNVIEIVYGDMSNAANWSSGSASIGINDLAGDATEFVSVTPGDPATASYTESNNTIAPDDIASISNGTIYSFTPNFVNNDLFAAAISPLTATPGQDYTPSVTVKNIGLNDASGYDVSLVLNDGSSDVYTSTKTISETLEAGKDTTIAMDVFSAIPAGTYIDSFYISYSSDQNLSNDTVVAQLLAYNSINMTNGSDTTCNALFYDSGGPDNDYSSSEDYTYTFYPNDPSKLIQVQFNSFDVEGEPFDYLQIYNGVDTNAQMIAQLGDNGPSGIIQAQNSDGALTFHFTSDGSVQHSGWEAVVSCYTPPQHDLEVTNISPSKIPSGSTVQPAVTIFNNGINEETSFDLYYTNADGTYQGTQSYTVSISAFTSDTVYLPDWSPADGEDTLTVYVSLSGDEDNSNDTIVQPVIIAPMISSYAWDAYASTSGLSAGAVNILIPFVDLSQISASSDDFIAGADMVYNEWYGVQYSSSGNSPLVKINTTTGQIETIGGGVPDLTGFTYDTKDTIAYAMDFNGVLYTVDLATGNMASIGGSLQYAIGLAADTSGHLFAINLNNGFFSIDPATGTADSIGDLGIDIGYAQDIAFDRDNGKLYGTLYASSGGLYEIDTATGAVDTLLNAFGDELTGFAIPYSFPGAWVKFVATDGTNTLPNTTINIWNHTLTTDANGEDSLFVLAGTLNYTATHVGYYDIDSSVTVVDNVNQVDTLIFTELPTYDLLFNVQNILGTAIENANVSVYHDTTLIAQGQTDTTGAYDAGSVYTYQYHYIVSADGYITAEGDTTISDQDVTVNVTLLEDMTTPYALQANQINTDADVEFSWNQAQGFTEDFEAGALSEGWTISSTCTDESGPIPGYWTVNDYTDGTDIVPFGTYHAGLWWSYNHQDEWLITPEFTAANGMEVSFYSVCYHGSTHGDHYYLKASADGGNTWDILWDASTLSPEGWDYYGQPYTVDLSAYAGQNIQLAFQAVDGDGQGLWYVFFVDNISVGLPDKGEYISFKPEDLTHISYSAHPVNKNANSAISKSGLVNTPVKSAKAFESYTVILDSAEYATNVTDSSIIFQDLGLGQHTAGVYAVYTTGNSDTAYIDFTVLGRYNANFVIKSSKDSSAIEGASLTIAGGPNDTTANATTDATGACSFDSIWEGSYTYSVSATGYNPLTDATLDLSSDTTITVLLTPTVSIAELNDNIQIYPNPVTDKLNIVTDKNYNFELTDMEGRTLIKTKLLQNSNTIKIHNLPSGVYIIKLYDNQTSYNYKILKK